MRSQTFGHLLQTSGRPRSAPPSPRARGPGPASAQACPGLPGPAPRAPLNWTRARKTGPEGGVAQTCSRGPDFPQGALRSAVGSPKRQDSSKTFQPEGCRGGGQGLFVGCFHSRVGAVGTRPRWRLEAGAGRVLPGRNSPLRTQPALLLAPPHWRPLLALRAPPPRPFPFLSFPARPPPPDGSRSAARPMAAVPGRASADPPRLLAAGSQSGRRGRLRLPIKGVARRVARQSRGGEKSRPSELHLWPSLLSASRSRGLPVSLPPCFTSCSTPR